MIVETPEIDSEWHYPAWTNGRWSGPWRVVGVGLAADDNEDVPAADLRVVRLERVDGPPESWMKRPYEAPLADWPGGWEPWAPEIPDYPPAAA